MRESTLNESLRFDLAGKTLLSIMGALVAIIFFWANFSNKVENVISRQNEEIETRKEMQRDIEKIKDDVFQTREDIAAIKGSLGIRAQDFSSLAVQPTPPPVETFISPAPQRSVEVHQTVENEPSPQPQPTPNQQEIPQITIPTPIGGILDILL